MTTSANRSDQPIDGIAGAVVTHDRPIHLRCDDAGCRLVAGRPTPLRRSRGDAPLPIPLPSECRVPIFSVETRE